MKRNKTTKKQALRSLGINAAPIIDVRPLDQRERPLKTRKGMKKTLVIPQGMTGKELEQLLFDNSQRNCNGYVAENSL